MKINIISALVSIPVMASLVFTSCGQLEAGSVQSSAGSEVIESAVEEEIENSAGKAVTESAEAAEKAETKESADAAEKAETKESADAAEKAETKESAEADEKAETTESTESAVSAESTEVPEKQMTVPVKAVKKHGNVLLDTSIEEMEKAGFAVGDIITVSVGDKSYDMPIGTSYNDVDSGSMILRYDNDEKEVSIGINMGSFAEESGLAEKKTIDKDPGYEWDIKVSEVGILLKEKEGFLKEYKARNLERSDNREDYSDISDEDFANFRAVSVSGIKKDLLYRSSSPIDPSLGRDKYAMAATEKAGIKSIVNLTDSIEQMKAYESYPDSYYSGCAVINPEMNYDFLSPSFGEYVKESVVFLTENEGPYLIHCKEGKDRTGILCALIEAYAGASAEEIKNDYMHTYLNFYKVKPEDESYDIILNGNLIKTLCGLFQIDSIDGADLKEEASEYFLSIGITEEQLGNLRSVLMES